MEVATTNNAEHVVSPVGHQSAPNRFSDPHFLSTSASARHGLPDPRTIGNRPTNTTAPLGGSFARVWSGDSPYLSCPRRKEYHGNAGSTGCAPPASAPPVSPPPPSPGAVSPSHFAHSPDTPGVCPAFKNASSSCDRAPPPVRYKSHPPL